MAVSGWWVVEPQGIVRALHKLTDGRVRFSERAKVLLMIPVAVALALPCGLWMLAALLRGSVPLSCAFFLVATACMPAELFAIQSGGLTWTLDRLWLLVLLMQFGIQWYRGQLAPLRIETTDILLGLFVLWLLARTFSQSLAPQTKEQPATLMHLINGYLIPLVIMMVLRFSRMDGRQLQGVVWVLGALGLYLSLTALFEVARLWQLVYPKFIADPTLGIHFGRARGPMLQSVRLGMCLLMVMITVIVFTAWLRPTSKPLWLVCLWLVPLHLLGIFLTYTRSIWMGAALIAVLVVMGCMTGLARRMAITGMLAVGLVGLAIKGPDVVAFKREYSAAETRESTYMRASFAYVSWKMFQDKPLTGFGFNQFQVYNRPYLSDRSTELRLESIRGYVHHNSFLSLLVDLGLIGFCLYIAVTIAFARRTWQLWRSPNAPRWARGIALVSAAVLGVHWLQMAFHEVSFSAIENTLLFGSWGLIAACHWQFIGSPGVVDPAH